METNVENLLNKVSENVKELVKTETIVGEEFQMGEYTVKPVMKVGVGFGSGSGEDSKNAKCGGKGGGAGAGMGLAPVGFLAVKDGELTFIPAQKHTGIQAIIDKVPDLMDKAMDLKDKKDKAEKEEKKEAKKQ